MVTTALLKSAPFLILLAAGCHRPPGQHAPQSRAEADPVPAVIDAQNRFAFRLFHKTMDTAGGNMLISPLSIYLALSMVYNGAKGATQEGMQQTLQLENIPMDTLNTANGNVMDALAQRDSGVILDIANSIWYRDQGAQPLASFLQRNARAYHADIQKADFSPATVAAVNDWVAAHTQQKIKAILSSIDPADVMYLINAVYFKGRWKDNFDPKATHNRPFHAPGGRDLQVPFMTREDSFRYVGNDSLQMVELPYGNGTISMYVLLPPENTNLSSWKTGFGPERFQQYLAALHPEKITLRLPQWRYSCTLGDLKPVLGSLGMSQAFSRDADFSGMYPEGVQAFISQVIHKTYIEVNEEGTEAAAATSIGMSVTSMPLNPPPVMDVNRPFLYLIADRSSGAILFLGLVTNPAEHGA